MWCSKRMDVLTEVPDSFDDHSTWLAGHICCSISRMSSEEDVLAVPPYRCLYFYGLTKAAGSLGIRISVPPFLFGGTDTKDKYGFACG